MTHLTEFNAVKILLIQKHKICNAKAMGNFGYYSFSSLRLKAKSLIFARKKDLPSSLGLNANYKILPRKSTGSSRMYIKMYLMSIYSIAIFIMGIQRSKKAADERLHNMYFKIEHLPKWSLLKIYFLLYTQKLYNFRGTSINTKTCPKKFFDSS